MAAPKYNHYGKLDKTRKNVEVPKNAGFFVFPEELKGTTNPNIRKFVVFYFDDEADYDLVVDKLAIKKKYKEHPHMDSKKLVGLAVTL